MRILHVFRSPVGGLFRHVRDLARGQSALGHTVALFCDSSTGGNGASALLAETKTHCMGGIVTAPMARLPALSDITVISSCRKMATDGKFDIIHGHGAKGGLIARVVGRKLGIPSLYTPHGGSMHYGWKSPVGAIFLTTETVLGRMGSGLVFVCDYERRIFEAKIGLAGKPSIIAHNGLWPEEFEAIQPGPDATDLLFVGEVRHLKGIDLLFEAIRALKSERQLTLTVVGDGPELEHHKTLARGMGLATAVRFAGRLPIRKALSMGRLMIVPSRNESFPYVVLETAAAAVPIIATNVGGIAEMLPADRLCAPTAADIAASIAKACADSDAQAKAVKLSNDMRERFSAAMMARKITDFYATLLR